MPTFVLVLLLALSLCGMNRQARAETAESCQKCRDHNRVCLQNYSQTTCKSEYEICMKHCKPK
jgi:hypothetical protein